MSGEKTFDILDHLAGRTYPEEKVIVYFDEANIRKVQGLDFLANQSKDQQEVADLEKEIASLQDEIDKTSLVFHLRGFPLDVKESIAVKASKIEDKQERGQFQDISALEASTVKVTNNDGDTAQFNYDSLLAIAKALPEKQWEKLMSRVVSLSYESILYERVETNPDF